MTEEANEATLSKEKSGVADRFLSKVVSRKLLVWGTATAGLFLGMVPSDDWVSVCLLYIGSQASVDIVSQYLKAKRGE